MPKLAGPFVIEARLQHCVFQRLARRQADALLCLYLDFFSSRRVPADSCLSLPHLQLADSRKRNTISFLQGSLEHTGKTFVNFLCLLTTFKLTVIKDALEKLSLRELDAVFRLAYFYLLRSILFHCHVDLSLNGYIFISMRRRAVFRAPLHKLSPLLLLRIHLIAALASTLPFKNAFFGHFCRPGRHVYVSDKTRARAAPHRLRYWTMRRQEPSMIACAQQAEDEKKSSQLRALSAFA